MRAGPRSVWFVQIVGYLCTNVHVKTVNLH